MDQRTFPARPLRVYVVEPSLPVRNRLAAMLAEIGGVQPVGCAPSAREALRGVLAAQPEVVLVDPELPEGGVAGFLAALRRSAPAAAILACTNVASPASRALARRLGAAEVFDKSTEMHRVREALRRRVRELNTDIPNLETAA
jgi:DNA-binding NarL/FixJ family response regulator